MKAAGILLAVLVGAVALSQQPEARAQSAPVKVVDRTLLCTIYAHAGLRQIEVLGRSAVPDQGAAFVYARSFLPNRTSGTLVAVSLGGFTHNVTRCKPTRARGALTPKGLAGGRATQSEDEYDCDSPRRVVVRLRVAFEEPVTVRVDWADSGRPQRQAEAVGPARSAAFAIRTEAGRQIAYGDVLPSGAGRLFTGKGCVRD